MKVQWPIPSVLLSVVSVLFVSVHRDGLAAEAASKSKPPTGLYVSVTDIPATFIVRLSTNGTYQLRAESQRSPVSSQRQEGHWKWDGQRQEFLLIPTTNAVPFLYEFRRLRVDPRQSDTLQWIPLRTGGAAGGGVIDYVRFRREDE